MEIRCTNNDCGNGKPKLFGIAKGRNVIVTPSTSIEFVEDILQIEIKCPRCKSMTSILLSSGIDYDGL